jgi:hypothetical protein
MDSDLAQDVDDKVKLTERRVALAKKALRKHFEPCIQEVMELDRDEKVSV